MAPIIMNKFRKDKKPISLCMYVDISENILKEPLATLSDFAKVELVARGVEGGYDVIIASTKEDVDLIYLGHWNDGVV